MACYGAVCILEAGAGSRPRKRPIRYHYGSCYRHYCVDHSASGSFENIPSYRHCVCTCIQIDLTFALLACVDFRPDI